MQPHIREFFLKIIFLVWVVCFSSFNLRALDYKLSLADKISREQLESDVKRPGSSNFWYSCLENISYFTPNIISNGLDSCMANMLDAAYSFASFRNVLKPQIYRKNYHILLPYNALVNSHQAIPNEGVSIDSLDKLINLAIEDYCSFRACKNYNDQEEDYRKFIAKNIKQILLSDPVNKIFFTDELMNLVGKIFAHFYQADPLDPGLFSLFLKSKKELGLMLANLAGGRYALVSDNASEAMNVGIKNLKNYFCSNDSKCVMGVIDDDENYVSDLFKDPSIESEKIDSVNFQDSLGKINFALLILSEKNLDRLPQIYRQAEIRKIKLHIHITRDVFRRYFTKASIMELKTIFACSHSIFSISFDTTGLIFQGISATVFADANSRFFALKNQMSNHRTENINVAIGPFSIDFIIAYLAILNLGKTGLSILANNNNGIDENIFSDELSVARRAKMTKTITENFHNEEEFLILDELSKHESRFSSSDYRKFLESVLADIALKRFDAPSQKYTALFGLNKRECIRLAVLLFNKIFVTHYPSEQPVFLIDKFAHEAFYQQIEAVQGKIEIFDEINGDIDIEQLISKIYFYGSENIAAIIARLPNISREMINKIDEIASIAEDNDIFFHLDYDDDNAYLLQTNKNYPHRFILGAKNFAKISSWSADIYHLGNNPMGLSMVGIRRSLSPLTNLPTYRRGMSSRSSLEIDLAIIWHQSKKNYFNYEKLWRFVESLRINLAPWPGIEIMPQLLISNLSLGFRFNDQMKPLLPMLAKMMRKLNWSIKLNNDNTLYLSLLGRPDYREEHFLPKFISDLEFVFKLLDRPRNQLINAHSNQLKRTKTEIAIVNALGALYAENLLNID